jgi:hypothetical protein
MLRLPYLDRAVVPEAKIVNYLLNPRHSGGRAKARFLESFGLRLKDWQVLRDAIIAHAAANDVTASYQTRFGTRYEIDGRLPTPDGRAPNSACGMVCGVRGQCTALGDVGTEKDC